MAQGRYLATSGMSRPARSLLSKEAKPQENATMAKKITKKKFHEIKRAIKAQALTQKYDRKPLASALGVSETTVNNVKRAATWPAYEDYKADRRARIAQVALDPKPSGTTVEFNGQLLSPLPSGQQDLTPDLLPLLSEASQRPATLAELVAFEQRMGLEIHATNESLKSAIGAAVRAITGVTLEGISPTTLSDLHASLDKVDASLHMGHECAHSKLINLKAAVERKRKGLFRR